MVSAALHRSSDKDEAYSFLIYMLQSHLYSLISLACLDGTNVNGWDALGMYCVGERTLALVLLIAPRVCCAYVLGVRHQALLSTSTKAKPNRKDGHLWTPSSAKDG